MSKFVLDDILVHNTGICLFVHGKEVNIVKEAFICYIFPFHLHQVQIVRYIKVVQTSSFFF